MNTSVNPDALSRSLRRGAQSIASFVVAIGALAVVVWLAGGGDQLTFGPRQVPMAPGTGLLCMLLGAALLREGAAKPDGVLWRADQTIAATALALALSFVASQSFGFDLAFERWLSSTDEVRGAIRIGRTSLITALLFAAIALSILLRGVRGKRGVQSVILSLVLASGVVILQGYALGAPLLYGGDIIPVAAPTATLIVMCSLAGLLHLGPDSWPIRLMVPNARPGVLPQKGAFVWLALLLSSVILSSGFFWYQGEAERNEERTVATLGTIVTLKSRELGNWHRGHVSTASAISKRMQPAASILRRALPTASDAERRSIDLWMSSLLRENDYERVELFDSERRSVAYAGSGVDEIEGDLRLQMLDLPLSDTIVVHDLYRVGGTTRMVFWAPLPRDPGRDNSPGAWVALVVRANSSLYPLLRGLPVAYRTGEFVLWNVTDDSLHLVSEVRSEEDLPLRLSVARNDTTALAAKAFESGGGSLDGLDYRGIHVRGAALPVPNSNWLLVAKVDEAEIREPLLRAALRATVVTLLFLLGASAIIYALWYRRNLARTERELALLADRERGIAELQRNESRYARALRGTTDGLWDWDFTTGEIFVSPRWKEIVGASEDDDVNQPKALLNYFEPKDVARHELVLARHLEQGAPYDLEMQLRTQPADGPRWIRTRGEAERDEQGRALRMGGAITDVTRRRLTEASLRRSERVLRMRGAVNQAIVRAELEEELFQVICEIAVQQGGYLMAWVGLKEHDAGRSVTPVAIAGDERGYLRENPISWADNERGQGPTGRAIRLGEAHVAQDILSENNYALWREAARERGYQSSLSIPLSVGDEVVGAFMLYAAEPNAFDPEELALATELGRDISFGVGVLRDQRTLDAQREQLALFRQAIDRSADAIYVADVSTGLFIDFNTTALEQLGYSDAEMRELGPADIVIDLGSRGGLIAVAAAVRGAGGLILPSIHRAKDGSEVPVEVALAILELGQRTLMLGIARDISERVKSSNEREELQAQLTRAQKMESVGRLAGGVAHDFNNLLTVITTSADLALAELKSENPIRHDIVEIRNAGERAARLTRQLLAFSRQQVLKREVLNLNDVVSKFLTMLSRVIGEDIHLDLKLAPKVSNIFADAGQLEQVLMNLCVNACDAMPRGGTMTIGTGAATVDEEHAARRDGMTPGPYVTLSVTDTGVGMDKATQAKIFEPFFTTKEQGRGTGLGLSTVYGIIKQSGGSVWCYSEVGIGTTFRIYLPVTTEVAEEPVSAPARSLAAGKETVLVVEDEASIRFVARRVLERSGYTVLEADSGPAALALLAEHKGALDLVLSDLVMPGMTGIELAEELRKTRPSLKLLFTSGYSADVVSDRFRPDGDWNFISKPYGVRDLIQEVRRVLDS